VGTGISALAISKELYVANEETVILVAFLIFATFIGRTVAGPYKEWADGQIEVSLLLLEKSASI
jgi:F-type H+-transporting ATPase subunit b